MERLIVLEKNLVCFFEKRKQEANPYKAIIVFFVAMFLLSMAVVFSDYKHNYEIIFHFFLTATSVIAYQILSKAFTIGVLLFIPGIFCFWFLGKKLFGTKASLVETTYLFMLTQIFLGLIFILGGIAGTIFSPLGFLTFLLFFLFILVTLVSLKTIHNISYSKVVALIISTNIIAGTITMVLVFSFAFSMQYLMPVTYVFDAIDNVSGTTSLTYAYVYEVTGSPREICHVSLPDGWTVADKEVVDKLTRETHNLIYPGATVYYKDEENFIFFNYGLLNMRGFKECEKPDHEVERLNEVFHNLYEVDYLNHTTINENALEVCDSTLSNEYDSSIWHVTSGNFLGSKMGFEAMYFSSSGNDAEHYLLLKNIACYQN